MVNWFILYRHRRCSEAYNSVLGAKTCKYRQSASSILHPLNVGDCGTVTAAGEIVPNSSCDWKSKRLSCGKTVRVGRLSKKAYHRSWSGCWSINPGAPNLIDLLFEPLPLVMGMFSFLDLLTTHCAFSSSVSTLPARLKHKACYHQQQNETIEQFASCFAAMSKFT